MPFCSQCGNQVGATDTFCAKCGFRQPLTAQPVSDPLAGVTPRTASILCYIPVAGWIGAGPFSFKLDLQAASRREDLCGTAGADFDRHGGVLG